jgi:hypothetical protein
MLRWWNAVAHGALGLALIPLSGCESIQEKLGRKVVETVIENAIEKDTGKQVTVQTGKGSMVIETKDGNGSTRLETGSGTLPADWPSEVPMYPGAKIGMSMKIGKGFTLTQETADTPAQVAEFYRGKLDHLKQQAAMDMGNGQTVVWTDQSKPLNVTLSVARSPGKAQTNVTLIVSQDPGDAPGAAK